MKVAKDFDDLMRLLDSGLRLVTPTTPDGALMDSATGEISTSGRFASMSLPGGNLSNRRRRRIFSAVSKPRHTTARARLSRPLAPGMG